MPIGHRKMAEAAPCGLRTPHGPHSFGDDQLCPGLPTAPPYRPKHRGTYDYRRENAWDRIVRIVGRHRAAGDPDLAGPPEPMRPRPRLGWDGGHSDMTEDDKDSDDGE